MRKLIQDITPRFSELDGLGHINNSVFLQWFEQARTPIFEIFNPELDLKKWNLIIARTEVDYLKPVSLNSTVEVHTYLSKVGNSSMVIEHELYQNGIIAAKGKAVMIQYNYAIEKSQPITEAQRNKLIPFFANSEF
jgi:acyl-CoA thioester hydrolase